MTKLLATDLDGTILARGEKFNSEDINVLKHLGGKDYVRVVATGRTLQSAFRVLPDDFPIDYLVFSSGAGIYCWKTKQLLSTCHLGFEKTKAVVEVFKKFHVEYTLHHPIPENHLFFHPEGDDVHPDFDRYLEFNQPHAEVINGSVPQLDYTQTLAFVPDMNIFDAIKKEISGVKVVRATSPIDGVSIWMECFNPLVSKANGVLEVCKLERVNAADVSVVGNDYNDLDMLNAFAGAYVVANAPDELKAKFVNLVAIQQAPLADWFQRFTF
ncbi:HAD hydrolase family protein [Carboxylicivirga marina]|uniref:HAD family phosphatase n=1 Tax=Carboxylicivirga marina TaxID=2800988 RepID=A0ABS1HJU2_9BACT|nr:HAD family hydrolase [Carboxylicivirga marina]MBK3517945.1 HAD family phosphatase [Carboxylicivirga marina]